MINLAKKIFKKLVPNKELRLKIKKLFFPNCRMPKNIKIGASYSVWDGEELLEASIKTIRKHCEYINVVWQEKSWFNEPCNENLKTFLIDLKEKGLINEIILYEPDQKLSPNRNELEKRNLGLEYVKKAKCSHFLIMDVDEFYKEEDFEKAKKFIIENQITHSVCNLYTYSHINCRDKDVAEYFVSLIHKINKNTKLVMDCCSPIPWLVDPTRQIPINIFSKTCVLSNIIMHHYSGVRKNIERKYRNSSAMLNEEKQQTFLNWQKEEIEQKISTGKSVWAENIFNINIE